MMGQAIQLKKIALKIGSGATPRGGKGAYKATGISLIRSMNVYDAKFEYKDLAFIDNEQAEKLSNVEVKQNDILLNITGASVARCCMVPANVLPARVNQHVSIIRIDPKLASPDYVFFCLVSPEYKNQLLALAQGGATREALTKAAIEEFEVQLPNLEVQVEIAKVINSYGQLIENNTRRIAILETIAQNLYREWFINFRFPNHAQTQWQDTPQGKIPLGWETRLVKNFGEVVTGKTPSKNKPENYDNPDIQFIKTPDMHGGMFVLEATEMLSQTGADSQKNKYIPAGSVFVNCIGAGAGMVAINAEIAQTNQQINTVVLNKEYLREFLYFSLLDLKQTIINHGSTGATMINLSKGKFEALEIVTPTEDLLQRFSVAVQPIFQQILCLMKKNKNLKQQRDMLLPKLISNSGVVQ